MEAAMAGEQSVGLVLVLLPESYPQTVRKIVRRGCSASSGVLQVHMGDFAPGDAPLRKKKIVRQASGAHTLPHPITNGIAEGLAMTTPQIDLTLLRQWTGKTETRHDTINPAIAAALSAVLDQQQAPSAGDDLPPLWHWTFFLTMCRQSETGADGHPRRGGFLPPVPLPRRMWAGGRLRFAAPLPVGVAAVRTSRIAAVDVKQGKSGELAFVTVAHDIVHDGKTAINEEHDIVYRALPQPGATPPAPVMAPTDADWSRRIEPDPVLLFRYSALTLNSHRIHYDRTYVTEVEGYPGLVVHGPLIATLLADLLARRLPQARLTAFDFRAVGSLFDIEAFDVCGKQSADGKQVALWAQNLRGELAMQAQAVLA